MFLENIKNTYGEQAHLEVTKYNNIYKELRRISHQKEFLISCRKNYIYNRKTLHVTKGIENLHLYSATCRKRQQDICDKLKQSVLNLIIQDIFFHINFLKSQLVKIEHKLFNILPTNIVNFDIMKFQKNFFVQSQVANIPKTNEKITFIKNKYNNNNNSSIQINQHKKLAQFSYDNDPWLTNLSNTQIPPQVQDLLRLGDDFCNPAFTSKRKQSLEVLKDVEKKIYKIPIDKREELRLKVVNKCKFYLSKNYKLSELDRHISQLYTETKTFLNSNPNIIVTKADKINATII